MVVGGRALEEEEEGAEELAPQAGNFAFYHTKASEYPAGPTAPTQRALRPGGWGGCRGARAPAGQGGGLWGARQTPLRPATALTLAFHALGPGKSGPRPDCPLWQSGPWPRWEGQLAAASPWHSRSVCLVGPQS